MTRRTASEAGVTLVELLVVVAMVGLVAPALTSALVVGWRTTDDTVARLADSRNREVLPSLFVRDVQNAATVDTDSTDTTCLRAGDALLVRLRWTETPAAGSAVDTVAAWVVTTGAERRVERRACASSSPAGPPSSVTAAHGVVGTPGVVCRRADRSPTSCADAVVVDLTVTDASGDFTATGRRRAT